MPPFCSAPPAPLRRSGRSVSRSRSAPRESSSARPCSPPWRSRGGGGGSGERRLLLAGRLRRRLPGDASCRARRTGVAVGTVVAIGSAPAFAGLFARPSPVSRCAGAGARTPSPARGVCLLVLGGGAGGEVSTSASAWRSCRGRGLCRLRGREQAYARRRRLARGGDGRRLRHRRPPAAAGVRARSRRRAAPPGGAALALYLGAIPTALAYVLFARGLDGSGRGDRDAHARRAAHRGRPRRDRPRRAPSRRGRRGAALVLAAWWRWPSAARGAAQRALRAVARPGRRSLREPPSRRARPRLHRRRSRRALRAASSRASSPPATATERDLTERYGVARHSVGRAARARRRRARHDRAAPRRQASPASTRPPSEPVRAARRARARGRPPRARAQRRPPRRCARAVALWPRLRPPQPRLGRRRRRPQRRPPRDRPGGQQRAHRARYDGLAGEMRLFLTALPHWTLERMAAHHEELLDRLEQAAPQGSARAPARRRTRGLTSGKK